jgi:hypothetical protein
VRCSGWPNGAPEPESAHDPPAPSRSTLMITTVFMITTDLPRMARGKSVVILRMPGLARGDARAGPRPGAARCCALG